MIVSTSLRRTTTRTSICSGISSSIKPSSLLYKENTNYNLLFTSSSTRCNNNNNNNNKTAITRRSYYSSTRKEEGKVIVLGGTVRDIIARPSESSLLLLPRTSNPGNYVESDGGVGRNITEVLARFKCQPIFYTAAAADDDSTNNILNRLKKIGTDRVVTTPTRGESSSKDDENRNNNTNPYGVATFLAVLDENGDLYTAIACNMDIFRFIPIPSSMEYNKKSKIKYLIMDANPPLSTLKESARIAAAEGVEVCLEPTSVPKAKRIAQDLDLLSNITYTFPNIDELKVMVQQEQQKSVTDDDDNEDFDLEAATSTLLHRMNSKYACVIVTMGKDGILFAEKKQKYETTAVITMERIPTIIISSSESINTTGAGDTFCGAFFAYLLSLCNTFTTTSSSNKRNAIQFAMKAASMSVQTQECAISPNLSNLLFKEK